MYDQIPVYHRKASSVSILLDGSNKLMDGWNESLEDDQCDYCSIGTATGKKEWRRQDFIISASYKQPNMERFNHEVSELSTNLPNPGNDQRIQTKA